ncbi:hypothetical protein ACJX0J_024959, partial [Zea mays]
ENESSGCFGCAQPTPIIAVDEPTKGLRIQGRSVKRHNLSDDFWSSSPHEMENSALQSRHSMSSISTAAQPNDQHASGSSSSPNEFVNQGLLLWHQTRQQWIGKRRHNSQGQQSQGPKISCNATYESLLGSSKPFPQPIPLGVRYLEKLHDIFHLTSGSRKAYTIRVGYWKCAVSSHESLKSDSAASGEANRRDVAVSERSAPNRRWAWRDLRDFTPFSLVD